MSNSQSNLQTSLTMDELQKIREHIARTVTHIAREHQVMDDVVWKQMRLAAIEHSEATTVKAC